MTKQSKHTKRMAMPDKWPIAKKGNKYIMTAEAGKTKEMSMPICVLFRDLLGLVKTRKELKRILNTGEIEVNNKIIKSPKFPVSLFDIISIPKSKKCYVLKLSENGKLKAEEAKETFERPYKVIGKKLLKGGKMQINLYDGRNFLMTKELQDAKVNDSVIVDFKNNKITKHLPLKNNSFAWIIEGKHAGKKGLITEINKNLITIRTHEKPIKTIIENIFITEQGN